MLDDGDWDWTGAALKRDIRPISVPARARAGGPRRQRLPQASKPSAPASRGRVPGHESGPVVDGMRRPGPRRRAGEGLRPKSPRPARRLVPCLASLAWRAAGPSVLGVGAQGLVEKQRRRWRDAIDASPRACDAVASRLGGMQLWECLQTLRPAWVLCHAELPSRAAMEAAIRVAFAPAAHPCTDFSQLDARPRAPWTTAAHCDPPASTAWHEETSLCPLRVENSVPQGRRAPLPVSSRHPSHGAGVRRAPWPQTGKRLSMGPCSP